MHSGACGRAAPRGQAQLADHLASSQQVVVGACTWHGDQLAREPTRADVQFLWRLGTAEGAHVALGVCWARGCEPSEGLVGWRMWRAVAGMLACRDGVFGAVGRVSDLVAPISLSSAGAPAMA